MQRSLCRGLREASPKGARPRHPADRRSQLLWNDIVLLKALVFIS